MEPSTLRTLPVGLEVGGAVGFDGQSRWLFQEGLDSSGAVARVDHDTNDLRGTAPGDRRDETRSGVDPSDATVATVNDVNVTRAVDAHSQRGL